MSEWLKPPKLIYLIIGLPILAGLIGLILDLINVVNFPGVAGD